MHNDERVNAALTPSPSPEKKPLPAIASMSLSSPVTAMHSVANKQHLKLPRPSQSTPHQIRY